MTSTAERRRVPWPVWVVIAAVAIVGVIALLGGFSDVPVAKLPVVALGSTHIGNEITATITGSHLSTTAPVTGYDLDEGKVDLVVEATLTNVTDRSNVFADALVRALLEGVIDPDKDDPRLIEMRGGGSLAFLQAGLPTKVAYVWTVDSADVADGDPLIIGVFQRHPVADNPLFDDAQSAAEPVVRILTTVGAGS